LGNTITRTYTAKNELQTETRYLVPDPDGAGSGTPGTPQTTRYVYNGKGHIAYTITAEGKVTWSDYDAYGQLITSVAYTVSGIDLATISVNDTTAVGQLDGWRAGSGTDRTAAVRTERAYDARGGLIRETSYSKLLATGAFDTASEKSETLYTYSAYGELLQRRVVVNGTTKTETFSYDGLGRVTSTTDLEGRTTTVAFGDTQQKTTVTFANGSTEVSVYNLAGQLITSTRSASDVSAQVTSYKYDALGRLRIAADPLAVNGTVGHRTFFFYDNVGRRAAEVDADGTLTEYRYNANNSVSSTTTYNTRLPAALLTPASGTPPTSLVDLNGNPTSLTLDAIRPVADPVADRWNWNYYDASQRLIRTIDATGAVTVFAYDGASQLTSTTELATRMTASDLAALKSPPAPSNLYPNPNDPSQWQLINSSIAPSGTINGWNAYLVSVKTNGVPAAVRSTTLPTVVAGETLTLTMQFKAGSVNYLNFGMQGTVDVWGSAADSTATISGPGAVTRTTGGLFMVSGLLTNEITTVTITRTFPQAQGVFTFLYAGTHTLSAHADDSIVLANPTMLRVGPGLPVLPALNPANDRVSRMFYGADGQLIGALDAEGYVSKIVYDKAGRKIETIARKTRAGTTTGDFATIFASASTNNAAADNAIDIHNWWLYDARGFLAATIDGEGGLTRFHYTPAGYVDLQTKGQKLDPATLITTPPTLANLPAAPAGTTLETIGWTRNAYGQALTETRSLTGTVTTTTTYGYDVMRQLISTVTQAGGTDPRTYNQRYDGLGRLTSELSGIGSAVLAALSSPTQAQIDQVYIDYGTTYSYDAANRLTAKRGPKGAEAEGARTLYYYNADGDLAYQIDALGDVTEYRYNSFGQRSDTIVYAGKLAAATIASWTGGEITAAVRNAVTGLASAALDTAVHSDFNVDGTLKQSIDANGNVSTFTYNAFGELITSTVPRDGAATILSTRSYDRRGLLKTQSVDAAAGGKAITTSYGYDAFGRAIQLTNANNKITNSEYDRDGRLVKVTDALTNSTSYTYDARDNLVAVTDADGKITRYVYDKAGRKIATIDALGGVVANSYDADGRLVATREYLTAVSPAGLPLEVTEAALALPGINAGDRVTRYAYDKDGQLRFEIDGLGHVVEHVYDARGNAIRTVAYDGTIGADGTGLYSATWIASQVAGLAAAPGTRVSRAVYDAVGRLTYSIDALGQVTIATYDAKGQLTKQVQVAALYATAGDPTLAAMNSWATSNANATNDRTTRSLYDRKGQLAYGVDALGYVTRYEYDKLGKLLKQTRYESAQSVNDGTTVDTISITSPATARVTQFSYDSAGRLETTTDPAGFVTKLTLDQMGQILSSTDAFGTSDVSTTAYEYDAVGNVINTTDALGNIVHQNYDALGRVIAIIKIPNLTGLTTLPGTGVDEKYYLATYADIGAAGVNPSYHYSISGWRERRNPDAMFNTGYYLDQNPDIAAAGINPFEHFLQSGWREGRKPSANYSAADYVAQHENITETFSYDETGRLAQHIIAAGTSDQATTKYTYNALGQLKTTTDARGTITTRVYDALGQLSSTTQEMEAGTTADDIVTTYAYDNFGKAWKVTDPRGNAGYFYYDKLGQLVLQIDPEGYATRTTYTINGKPDTVTRYDAKPTGTPTATTSPTIVTTAGKDAVTRFTYDKRDQILSVQDAEGYTESYSYNGFGDRQTVTNKLGGITTNSYDKRGLLLSETFDTNNVTNRYTYDARGNRKTMVEADLRTTSWSYDLLDQVKDKTSNQTAILNANLIGTTNKAVVEYYQYDKRGNVIQSTDANGARSFAFYDYADRKIAEIVPTSATTGTLKTYTFDAAGNITAQRIYGTAVTLPGTPGGAVPVGSGEFRETLYQYDRNNRLITAVRVGVAYGEYDNGTYTYGSTDIVTRTRYDAAGNVVAQTDGRGNDSYTYYNKLGQKIAQVDAEKYLTTYTLDQNGNVKSEIRYAKQLTVPISEATVPSPPTSLPEDRRTDFSYDRNGRRVSETRFNVAVATVSGSNVPTITTTSATISYSYNGLGQVLQKNEANNDYIKHVYDKLGRETHNEKSAYLDYRGISVIPATDLIYNGLNQVQQSTERGDGTATAADRVTIYNYDAGGRLTGTTDPTGFATSYYYDQAGRLVAQIYARLKSDGSSETNGNFLAYDLAGRETSRKTGVLSGGAWTFGDTNDQYYNGYGDIIAQGTNTGGVQANAQGFADYDKAGRVWRTNIGDGITKVYAYDRNGNATMLLQSIGSKDLRTYADLNALVADNSGVLTQTISDYDKRNQLIDTIQPSSNNAGANPVHAVLVNTSGSGTAYFNASGSVTSPANAVTTGATGVPVTSISDVIANKSSNITVNWIETYGHSWGQDASEWMVYSWNANIPAPSSKGSGNIRVFYNGTDVSLSTSRLPDGSFFVSGTDSYWGWPNLSTSVQDFKIYQEVPETGGTLVLLASVQLTANGESYDKTITASTPTPAAILFKNEGSNTTSVVMLVRPANSSGPYSKFNTPPLQNKSGTNVAGWFTADLTQPPFNGLPAGSSWDVKYLAMDANGAIYDSKQGTLTVDGNGNPSTSFTPVLVGGPGQAVLTRDYGSDWLILSSLPAAPVRLLYRPVGSSGAWSSAVGAPTPGYGQNGLAAYNVSGIGGPVDYWVELADGTKVNGTFTVGGQASALKQYADGSRAITLNPPSGQTVTLQQFRYFQNGAWSSWITRSGGGSWTYDAAALADFYTSRSYPIQYETYNGATLVSQSAATLTLGYDGQGISNFTNTQASPARVVFTPQQPSATRLMLYWRDAGSSGAFNAATVAKVNGVFTWDVDTAGARPVSGTRNLEYYYDAYASDSPSSLLPTLNGADHAFGYLSIQSDRYTNTSNNELRWVIDTRAASSYLIHRLQSYNAFGEIVQEIDGKNFATNFTYNTLGKMTSKVSPQVTVTGEAGVSTRQSPTETYYYDISGRLVATRDANNTALGAGGKVFARSLLAGSGHGDDTALALSEYQPDASSKAMGYDIFGNLRFTTNEIGATTKNTYDKAGRLIQVEHPVRVGGNSPGTQLIDYYSYDGLGQRIKHTNSVYGASVAETTDYDTQGRVVRSASFGGLVTSYAYAWYGAATNLLVTTGLGNFGGWQTITTNSAGLKSYENNGLFGQINWRRDFGGRTTFFTYDLSGHLRNQAGTNGQSIDFTYYTNGYVASITDNAVGMKSTFEYDNEGNRTLETYNSTDAAPVFYQNAAISYDELGRIIRFKDAKAEITYLYDANGNRREMKSVYNDGLGGGGQTQDYWYSYDSMNRFVVTMGSRSGGTIVAGSTGVAIAYDAAGNRRIATYGYDGHSEAYSYTADGYLEDTTIGGVVRTRRVNDALGRVTGYSQYLAGGGLDLSRSMTYDRDNRVVDETDQDVTNGNITTTIHNDYKAWTGSSYTGADQGVITHSRSVQSGITTDTSYSYEWWDEAKQSQVRINATNPANPNTGQWAAGYSNFTYDVNGHLLRVTDSAVNRVLSYQNDAYGQVLVREQTDNGQLGPRQLYYYFNGRRIGDVGNDGPNPARVDYAQELAQDRGKAAGKGGFRNGQPVASADFDQNYQPINGNYPGQAATSYTVRTGDTLSSITQAAWGDANLWYLIAEANGLFADSALTAGQTLSIPNKVTNFHDTSDTFRVYSPGEAIGDTLPT
ncbi:LysM peptidoglycan-binding domain-containing protein, partial [Sphingomonas sp. ERG5]|uniref:LysM peptidoglycan-binding domain-containing protein n=1 Tax=Sphingomonas sp. ERG5 TaxID=1381597 RepID=UPI00054B4220